MKDDKKVIQQKWLESLWLRLYLSNKLKNQGDDAAKSTDNADDIGDYLAKEILSESAILMIEPTRKCYAKAAWILFKKALGYQVFDLFIRVRRRSSEKDTSFDNAAFSEEC
jgi:hypothetical protein